MQFSEQWLREYTNPAISTDALSHLLTMAGLEVEGLEPAGAVFNKVVVAEILSAEKHPDADLRQAAPGPAGPARQTRPRENIPAAQCLLQGPQ